MNVIEKRSTTSLVCRAEFGSVRGLSFPHDFSGNLLGYRTRCPTIPTRRAGRNIAALLGQLNSTKNIPTRIANPCRAKGGAAGALSTLTGFQTLSEFVLPKYLRLTAFACFSLFIFFACHDSPQPKADLVLVNLAHLNHLYEEIEIDGKDMAIIHIYSEYPDYAWVDAQNEGIACVDDAARAAVLYLRHFENTNDATSLRRARRLIDFCRHLQAEDGLFYNFIFADHTINREGKTSFKSLGWWTARGVWALGEGYRVFRQRDPPYAEVLKSHLEKTFAHIDTLLRHFPQVDSVDGFPSPKWLLYNSAADATSELLLGLAAYAQASSDERVKPYLKFFAEGLLAMQTGDAQTFPFGLFLSWRNIWHGWANSQAHALAIIGELLDEEKLVNAAKLEASHFYPYWIKQGFTREFEFARGDSIWTRRTEQYSQIAYAIRPPVLAALALHRITNEDRFAELAGELATWFFGNNPARAQMYDPQSGRAFDGILSQHEINRNAGAESTIEALYALLEVEADSTARRTLQRYRNRSESELNREM